MTRKAAVIGAGPNGLAAAIVLAQAGFKVEVFEAEPIVGGGARTMELTLPGYRHDFGSAVHPMARGSPFFASLPLERYGLEWIHPPAPLAHPLDHGSAVVLERDLEHAKFSLSIDGEPWSSLVGPFAEHWREFSSEVLRPIHFPSRYPGLMVRFGLTSFRSATSMARRFRRAETRALFAGLAAHSMLSLEERLSGAFGVVLAVAAHAVGWPIARGGSQAISDALCRHLRALGGEIRPSTRIESLASLSGYEPILCDVTPRQLLKLTKEHFSDAYRRRLESYRYGPGVFKVDYALSQPIPWQASGCLRAATVHLGGSFEEIALSERTMRAGQHAERPFVLLAQPSLFDATRAPQAKHTAWAYCHVPNGSSEDMLSRLEDQIERFAPGFRDCVLARRVFSPTDLERLDANLVGGDIGGGLMDLKQFLARPTWRHYATSAKNIYICSSSTPPGGGVHGMCGYNAAKMALARFNGA